MKFVNEIDSENDCNDINCSDYDDNDDFLKGRDNTPNFIPCHHHSVKKWVYNISQPFKFAAIFHSTIIMGEKSNDMTLLYPAYGLSHLIHHDCDPMITMECIL